MPPVALVALLVVLAACGPADPSPSEQLGYSRHREVQAIGEPIAPPEDDDAAIARLELAQAVGDAETPPGDAAIEPPPPVFDGPAEPPAPPPPELWRAGAEHGGLKSGGVWAVIIGINDYPGSKSDLRSAVRDAEDVNEALDAYGVPASRRLVLRDRQATANMILTAADWLVANAGPDATAVFFYAGHVRKVKKGTEVIVGADGGLVHDADLGRHFKPLEARQAWFALAACYSGGFSELLGPRRVLTAATDANSLAYENETFGRSYLVQFMVRQGMLEGRAAENVQQSFAYAREAIAKEYPNRVPVQFDQAGGPLVLGTRPSTKAAGTAAPAPASAPAAPAAPDQPRQAPPAPPPSTPARDDGCSELTLGVVACDD